LSGSPLEGLSYNPGNVKLWESSGTAGGLPWINYLHYLPLLEQKPGSLDYARPLLDLKLPECFEVLRRRLVVEEEKEGEGSRESSESFIFWKTIP